MTVAHDKIELKTLRGSVSYYIFIILYKEENIERVYHSSGGGAPTVSKENSADSGRRRMNSC